MEAESLGATRHRLHQGKGRCRVTGEAWEPLTMGPRVRGRVQPADALPGDPSPIQG